MCQDFKSRLKYTQMSRTFNFKLKNLIYCDFIKTFLNILENRKRKDTIKACKCLTDIFRVECLEITLAAFANYRTESYFDKKLSVDHNLCQL